MQELKREFMLDAHNALLIDELYRANGRTILAFVRRQVSLLEEAEDIVLEVFVAALESAVLTKLSEQQRQAWSYRVARNKCIDHLLLIARIIVNFATMIISGHASLARTIITDN